MYMKLSTVLLFAGAAMGAAASAIEARQPPVNCVTLGLTCISGVLDGDLLNVPGLVACLEDIITCVTDSVCPL